MTVGLTVRNSDDAGDDDDDDKDNNDIAVRTAPFFVCRISQKEHPCHRPAGSKYI